MSARPLPTLAVCFLFAALPALANDWPQWRGPDRTDISRETGLLKKWPAGGPKLVWTCTEAGAGYSGPAIVGDRIYAMGAEGEKEFIYALDAKSGKKLWSREIGPRYNNDRGGGPRGTPTVDGDALYAMSGKGNLVCVAAKDGTPRWSVSMTDQFGGKIPTWGYAESPLVDGDQVVCTPGGAKGALAALDKKTGEVLWRSKDLTDAAHYASMLLVQMQGLRMYVQTTAQGVVGVSTNDGRLLWRDNVGSNKIATIPTPIYHDGHVFVTSGYRTGCALIKLIPQGDGGCKAETVYSNNNMENHHGGVVLVGEHLYGYSDGKGWVCMEFKTGKIVWSEKAKLGKGSMTCADGHFYCYSEKDGTAVLIEISPKGWIESGRFEIPAHTKLDRGKGLVWTHPVIANGRLYLRDQDLLFCFDVQAGK